MYVDTASLLPEINFTIDGFGDSHEERSIDKERNPSTLYDITKLRFIQTQSICKHQIQMS